MNKLLFYPIIIMIFAAWFFNTIGEAITFSIPLLNQLPAGIGQYFTFVITFNALTIFAIFTTVLAVAIITVVSFSILGTGIQISNDTARIIIITTIPTAFWAVLTVSAAGIFTMPYGDLFYTVLTASFILGVVEWVSGRGASD